MVRIGKRWTAVAGLTLFVSALAWAAVDANGKWSWKQRGGQGGNEVEIVLELKADGEKLTGTVARGEMKTPISEGTIKGSDVSFVVIRERNGQQNKTVYKGKLDGDTIKGNMITNRQGQERSVEWVANRAK